MRSDSLRPVDKAFLAYLVSGLIGGASLLCQLGLNILLPAAAASIVLGVIGALVVGGLFWTYRAPTRPLPLKVTSGLALFVILSTAALQFTPDTDSWNDFSGIVEPVIGLGFFAPAVLSGLWWFGVGRSKRLAAPPGPQAS